MYDYMRALEDRFTPRLQNAEQRQELEANRQAVSALLDKQGRKNLLRLVDAHMKDLSLSAKTIRGLHAMLRQCLDQAVQERLIPYNPAAGCKLPPKEKKEMQTLPAEKISAYLAAAEEHGVLPMFYLELTTGLRRGELAALLWTDLDLENQTLTVSKSAGRINGEVKITQPKTANSVRTIYLPKETVDLLIQEHSKHPGNPVMFPSPVTGKIYGPDCLGRLHKNLLKSDKLPVSITSVLRLPSLVHCLP